MTKTFLLAIIIMQQVGNIKRGKIWYFGLLSYITNEEIARANFNALLEKNKGKLEFKKVLEYQSGAVMYWFDPGYNEDLTRVYLYQTKIDAIDSIVF